MIEDENLDFYLQNKKIRSRLQTITDQYAFDKYSINIDGKGNKSVSSVKTIPSCLKTLGNQRTANAAKVVTLIHGS